MTGMTAPVVTASAALRPCEVCGNSLEGRRPQTRTCSDKCRVAKCRGEKPRGPRPCAHCGEEFAPKRSDAKYCPECRRSEPWRRSVPATPKWAYCECLDGRALAAWIEDHVTDLGAQLNGQTRTVQRWRNGASARIWTVDEVLTALGRHLSELPDEVWIDASSGVRV